MFKTFTIGKQMPEAATNAAPLAKPYVTSRSTASGRAWWSVGFSIIQLVFLWAFFSSALSAQIVNGSFETGTAGAAPASPWVVTDYLNYGFTSLTPQTFSSLNLISGGSALTTIKYSASGPLSQTDPDLSTSAALRWPRYGYQGAIVNSHGTNDNVNSLSQTFTINSANVDPADGKVHIRFVYAPVVQNPGHSYTQQPYYFVQLKNITQNTVLYEEFGVGGTDAGIPWQTVGSIQYKNWQLLDIAPGSPAVNQGDTVELDVIAAGCSQGGHWGEVYVDGVGTTIPGITVEGTGPTLVKPGDNLTYSLNFRNGATTAESGVVMQFTTPPSTTFQSLGSSSYNCTTPTVGTSGTVSCTIGALSAGASGSLGITVNVASGITAGTLIERNYSISSTQETLLVGTPISTKIWSATNTVTADQSSVDFGNVAVAAGTGTSKTVTFTVPSGVTLGSVSAVTQGASNRDFKVLSGSGTTCANGTTNKSCTVEVQFLPTAPGMRLGAIVLYDTNAPPNVLSTIYLTGTGLSSDITFSPSPQITVSATGLNLSAGVAVDAAGDVFIADSDNDRVVEVTPSGTQTTTVTGLNNPLGVAVDGAGNVFIADSGNNQVVEVMPGGGQTAVPATGLSSPSAVAVDGAGDVFIADSGNNRVVEVTPSGIQTTVPATGLSSPKGVAVDAAGDVFIADSGNNQVVKVTPSGTQTTVPATGLSSPKGVAVDAAGNVFIADSYNNQVVEVTPGGTQITLPVTGLNSPNGVAVDGVGDVFIADVSNSRAVELQRSAPLSLTFAATDVGNTSTDSPQSVTIQNVGNQPLDAVSPGLSIGLNFVQVAGSGQPADCNSTFSLAPGADCNLSVSFSPQSVGNITSTATFTDNNLGASSSTQAISLSGKANPSPVTAFILMGYQSTVSAGSGLGFTVTAMNGTNVASNYAGTVNFTASDSKGSFSPSSYTFTASDAGVHTFTSDAYLYTAGNQTITVTDQVVQVSQTSSNIAVTAGSFSTIGTVAGGSGQSAVLGAAFTNPLGVLVTDTWGNPISDITINYTAPSTGASAVLSSGGTVVTGSDGTASLTATANDTAGPYTITASSPSSPSVSAAQFSLTNSMATPSVVLTPSPASPIVYGQAKISLGAQVTSTTGTPTGSVIFSDGSVQTPSVTLSAGAATSAAQYYASGTHAFTATYSGDANYKGASSVASNYTVTPATSTLAGPATQPVFVVNQTAGSIPVTIAGQYSGTGINQPSGSISYSVYLGSTLISSDVLAITNGAASVPVASTLAPGVYSVALAYNGDTNYSAATSISVSLQVGQIQPTINWVTSSSIGYGSTLSGLLNAQAANASTTVPGSYAYTATPAGGSPSAVTSATKLAAGTYTLSVLFTPTDAQTYKTATGTVTLVVGKATPGVSVTSNSNPVLVQNSITLTATVSSTVSTPTGTVTFIDGTTPLGTGTVSTSGIATLSTSTLAVGSHSITAVYSGDTNFIAATSNALTQLVQDFNLTISIASSGGTAGVTSVTALPGGTAVYTFTLSPVGSTTFPATVTLSASGLPTGATYSFSPATLAAGAGSTQVTLTVNLPQVSAMNLPPTVQHTATPAEVAQNKPSSKLPFLALGLLLLPFTRKMRRASSKFGRLLPLLLLFIAGLAAFTGLSGCSKPSGYFGQAPATYTISVTGTSGTLTHSTSVTLIVQ